MKKLLVLLLIALAGAGTAYGANLVFFNAAADKTPDGPPHGLGIEQLADDVPVATASPSPSPTPAATAIAHAATGQTTAAAPPPSAASATVDGHRVPRTPRGSDDTTGGSSTTVVSGTVSEPSTNQDCDEPSSEQCDEEQDSTPAPD